MVVEPPQNSNKLTLQVAMFYQVYFFQTIDYLHQPTINLGHLDEGFSFWQ